MKLFCVPLQTPLLRYLVASGTLDNFHSYI